MVFRIALAAALALAGWAVAADEGLTRVTIPGESGASARRLAEADKLASEGKWPEAVAEYQRLVDEAGEELVPLDAGPTVQVRRLCQQRFAALPPEALTLYREKVDARARQWLEQGALERDPRRLLKVVDEAFASRPAERALDQLGDQAFERGDFDAAERYWQMLVPPLAMEKEEKSPRSWDEKLAAGRLVYPDPTVDRARIRAKQVLARWYRGETRDREAVLAAYRAAHGEAAGTLAGRTGRYADLLKDLAADLPLPPASSWLTFAGSPTRTEITALPPPLYRPAWEASLSAPPETPPEKQRPKVLTAREQARLFAFFPVIAEAQILIADARSVSAFDLRTGQRTVWYDLASPNALRPDEPAATVPAPPDVRYTITVAGERVYARLGAQQLRPPVENARGSDSYVVCLRLKPDSQGRRECWSHRAGNQGGVSEFFEGAPIVHNGRAYIALSRFDGATTTTAIACYDAATGVPCWQKPVELCEVRDFRPGTPRLRHHLLTLAGSNLVYCSHSGAVVALEAETGRRLWAFRYPSRGDRLSDATPSPRDLAPAVYSAGRLFLAPADYDRIFCLDAGSGRKLWESDLLERTVHLIGAAHERLFLTTTRDLRALDCLTGRPLRDWVLPGTGDSLPPLGRGLLAGNLVLWPTVEGLRALDQATGQPIASMPCNYTANALRGNLALGEGCLVVADATHLYAYVPPRWQLEQRRREAAADPDSGEARFALALAEADAGGSEAALGNFARAEAAAGDSLRTAARAERHALLMRLADQRRADRDWRQAAEWLAQAAAPGFSVTQRLHASAAQSRMWAGAGQPTRALESWQRVLDDEALRRGLWPGDEAFPGPIPAAALAQQQIATLIRAHGSTLRTTVEGKVKALLEAAKTQGKPETILQVAQRYPYSEAASTALLDLGRRDPRPAVAALAHRLWLRSHANDRARAGVLAGLARAYEAERCWDAARSTWRQLLQEFGPRELGVHASAQAMREFVAERVQPAVRPAATLSVPLWRSWQVRLEAPSSGPSATIAPTDDAALTAVERLLFLEADASGPVLCCREAGDGRLAWKIGCSLPLLSVSRHADILLMQSPTGVQAVRLDDGMSLWQFVAPESCPGWRLAAGRLFGIAGQRRLLALDAETGDLLWEKWAPGAGLHLAEPAGRFQPHFHATDDWLLVQTTGGQCCLYDTRTGEKRHELETAREAWPRPPLPLGSDRLCIVSDCCRLLALDAAKGLVAWSITVPRPSLSTVAPQLAGDGTVLLALIDGWQIERLDPATGKSLWVTGDPRWAAGDVGQPWQPAFSGDRFCFVRGNSLYAFALEDGRPLWSRALPEAARAWRTLAAEGAVVTYPLQRHATMARLGPAPPPRAENDAAAFSVFVHDATDGQPVQRLNFPLGEADAAVQILERSAVVVSDGRAFRLLAEPRP